MTSMTPRQVRRTARSLELVMFAVFGVFMGGICLVYGAYDFFQLNQFLRNSFAVNGTVSEKFYTYHIDSKGDKFPEYNLRYSYPVNGAVLSQAQEVNSNFFNRYAVGQTIVVYYQQTQPSVTRIDVDGLLGAPRAMVGIGAVIFILGLIVLGLMYRHYFLPAK